MSLSISTILLGISSSLLLHRPGKAPIEDSCGMAGGNTFEVFNAGAYNDTVNAKQGDLGTKVLKPRPSGTVCK